jgi:hypothetical protein
VCPTAWTCTDIGDVAVTQGAPVTSHSNGTAGTVTMTNVTVG